MSSNMASTASRASPHLHDPPSPLPWIYTLAILGLLICISLCHYNWLSLADEKAVKRARQGKVTRPPLVPHCIPLVGSLPLGFLRDSRKIFSSFLHRTYPVGVRLLGKTVYFLQGRAPINAIFNEKRATNFFLRPQMLHKILGLSKEAVAVYHLDTSGFGRKPTTEIEARNRVEHLTRSSWLRFLTGPGLKIIWDKFQKLLMRNLSKMVDDMDGKHADYIDMDDFVSLFRREVTISIVETICGPYVPSFYRGFITDFWIFADNFMWLMLPLPKFVTRKVHAARARCVGAIRAWHSCARAAVDPYDLSTSDDSGNKLEALLNHREWGTNFMAERHVFFSELDGHDSDAIAAQDLGFIWGAAANSVMANFWACLEIFRNPSLLAAVRREVDALRLPIPDDASQTHPSQMWFADDMLIKQPLLLAVYYETLRLYVNSLIVRRPSMSLHLGNWLLPANHTIITASAPAHLNPLVWNQNPLYPYAEFHPERFLTTNSIGNTVASLTGFEGAWIPYGGGVHACPGQHFAVREIITTIAILVSAFDIEVLADVEDMEMDACQNFGLGVPGPKGKVPVRIRRRHVATQSV